MTEVLIEQLIITLNNIQSKIDTAAGAATALELRLRIIAQLEPLVQTELKLKTKDPFYKVDLFLLIDAVVNVFQTNLTPVEIKKIQDCRVPRNKAAHGSIVELMLKININPEGREINPQTGKRNTLAIDDLVEGIKSIDGNRGLEIFTAHVREAITILDQKILRSLI